MPSRYTTSGVWRAKIHLKSSSAPEDGELLTLTQSSFALTAGEYLLRLQSCFSAEVLAAVETLADPPPG